MAIKKQCLDRVDIAILTSAIAQQSPVVLFPCVRSEEECLVMGAGEQLHAVQCVSELGNVT